MLDREMIRPPSIPHPTPRISCGWSEKPGPDKVTVDMVNVDNVDIFQIV